MVPDLDSQAQSGYSLHGTFLPLVDLRVVLGPTSVLPFSAAALISWPAYLVDRCHALLVMISLQITYAQLCLLLAVLATASSSYFHFMEE